MDFDQAVNLPKPPYMARAVRRDKVSRNGAILLRLLRSLDGLRSPGIWPGRSLDQISTLALALLGGTEISSAPICTRFKFDSGEFMLATVISRSISRDMCAAATNNKSTRGHTRCLNAQSLGWIAR